MLIVNLNVHFSTNIPGAIFSGGSSIFIRTGIVASVYATAVIGRLVARHLRCRHAADERDYAIEFLKRYG